MTNRATDAAGIAAVSPTCEHCIHLGTFTPRADERERYDFGDIGYECRKLNYEGYTTKDGWCPSFFGKHPRPESKP